MRWATTRVEDLTVHAGVLDRRRREAPGNTVRRERWFFATRPEADRVG